MMIEIRRAGFVNKGAHLMQRAVLERLKAAYPEAEFTMAPSVVNPSQSFSKLVNAGFRPKASLYWGGVQYGDLVRLLPGKLRSVYGLVLDHEVNVIIDAAGFSYSDQWGSASTRELCYSTKRWRRNGTKIVLMPQAFGPFTSKPIRQYIRQAVTNADLVMPRDSVSYDHLVSITGERENIKQFPDFTNLVAGRLPAGYSYAAHRVCLVPNYRMIDKACGADESTYVSFMTTCAKYLLAQDAKPFLLILGGESDAWLAARISEGSGGIPILNEDDPLIIKGILSACHATIGSRFHGLVSALSEGVPSLATGWSHKYLELLKEFGVPEFVIAPDDEEHTIVAKIEHIIEEASNARIRIDLLKQSERLKKSSEAMWKQVFRVIDHRRQ